jgi:hypothetical protein
MAELLHEYTTLVEDMDETAYVAKAWGRQRTDGMWEGSFVFVPVEGGGQARQTDRETTQPNLDALLYWAAGIEPIYLEGALERSTPLQLGSSAA